MLNRYNSLRARSFSSKTLDIQGKNMSVVFRQLFWKFLRLYILIYFVSYFIVSGKWSAVGNLFRHRNKSNSQILQDLIVASYIPYLDVKEKFFVEFGATNGISLSNTYMLEKFFGFSGAVAEPGRIWLSELKQNRSCFVSNKCIWNKSGQTLLFREASNPDLSALSYLNKPNIDKKNLSNFLEYKVQTLSLNDFLKEANAPKEIIYLSIDTEGSELTILRTLDFDQYSPRVITCEHNWSNSREQIKKLLESKGYRRRHKFASFQDDYYFLKL